VKAGVVQTVQNVVGASAKRPPSGGVPCMMLLVVLRAFFLESMWHSFAWQVKWTTSTSSASPCGSTVVARKVDNFDVSVLNVVFFNLELFQASV